MKTFDDLYADVIGDKSVPALQVFQEIAKRYAIQCVEADRSEILESFAPMPTRDGNVPLNVSSFSREVYNRKIILP